MDIAVIGGAGFIGTRLVARLREQGHRVVSYDIRPGSATHADDVVGDVNDVPALTAALAGVECVVNLAAEHRDDVQPVSRYDRVNVEGARSLVTAAEELGIQQIVFTSTVALYGLDAPDASEQTPPDPFNDYGRTKLEAEGVLRAWAAGDDARGLLVVRPCVIFGESNRGNVYNLVRQIASRRFLRVGPGTNRKSMAYVGNVVEYISSRLPVAPGVTVRNYADKPDLSTRELVTLVNAELGRRGPALPSLPLWLGLAAGGAFDLLARVTGRTLPISRVRIRKFAADTTVDASLVASDGFVAPYTVEQGLARTIATEFPRTS